ncbi:MAG TPA: beta-1,6-N-acetylglucosaminyltransferase [Steroidobacteraceae bacterium]|nr:beta-1,6-N-acetylglucosaminyltransferase [Steroidobacteraceae bacterium]
MRHAQSESAAGECPPVTVAYLILTHANPRQLARLVGSLPAHSPVLIHCDRRTDDAVYQEMVKLVGSRPLLQFVKRERCWWGSFGIVQATINLIRTLVTLQSPYDYATLLSGSDYPIKSNTEIACDLDRNRGKEFIESFLLTAPNRWTDDGGYSTAPRRVLGRHIHLRSRLIRLPGLRTMPAGLAPYGGSQWWTLSAESIRYIAEFIEGSPEVVAFFKGCFVPDESFFQTIVANSRLAGRIASDNLRIAVWGRPLPPYPATLTMDDQEMLRSSEKHFARKFDPRVDSKILDLLDSWRLQREAS